jgi:hypothetical protein
MVNATRVKRLCGARAVPGKPGTLGMKTDDIKAKIKAHVDKLNKENPIRKEFTRGKKDRASLCMFLTKYREGQALLNASSNSPPSTRKKSPSPKKNKSGFEMTNGNGSSSSNNESAKSNNSGSENNIYNNETTPPLRTMPTRAYQSRAREKDPLDSKTRFSGKMKGRVNRLLRKKGQTSKTSYGDVLKNVLTFKPRAEGPKRRALSSPGRNANSGNSSANRNAAKSAVKGRKSTSANAVRRSRFARRRKPLSALKMSGGNGRVSMNPRRRPTRATRKPRSKYNVLNAYVQASNRMAAGRRAPGTQGPELPLNGANYQRMRYKFAGNAIAEKPAKKTPSPQKKSFNQTGLATGSNVFTLKERVALIRKKKVANRTTKEKRILRLYTSSQKNESNRKRRLAPTMQMMTGATNFVLEGSPNNKPGSSPNSGGGRKSASPNSGKRKAKYIAAAAKARAAAMVPAGGYARPKPKAKYVPSARVSPPKAKGPTPRNDRIRKLIENMQKQKAVPENVRRMAAKPTTTTIRNQQGSKGYYSLNE